MTIERRIIVGIEDIKGVCFECLNPECKARTTVPPDKIGNIPEICPRCKHTWITLKPGMRDAMVPSAYVDLASAIERIRALQKEGVTQGFRLLFEFDEPK